MTQHALQGEADPACHPPQVAGSFYPADPEALRAALIPALAAAGPASGIDPKIVVAPHAGIVFSGGVAATAFAPWARRPVPPRRIVIIGPAHRVAFKGLVLHPAAAFATPLGAAAVDWHAAAALLPLRDVRVDAAPFAGEHALELPLVLLQAVLPEPFEIVPVLVGDATVEAVTAVLRLLWGGSETVVVVSSDLSHFLDRTAATTLDRDTARRIEQLDTAAIDGKRACGHRPLAALLALAAERDMRVTGLQLATSFDTNGDATRVVGYGAFAVEYAAGARLTDADRTVMLETMMAGLCAAAGTAGRVPDLVATGPLSPALRAVRATFVTLERKGALRGCIGSLAPHRPLLGDALVNAVKAGFADPRFGPLSVDELEDLDLSVSILSHPRAMAVASEDDLVAALDPDRDGLILADGAHSALFLPSVWSSLPDPRAFVRQLKRKAGLAADHWSPTMTARRFRAEKFGAPLRRVDAGALAGHGLRLAQAAPH